MNHTTFAELNLSQNVLRALTEMGFEAPTPIQSQCIPSIMEGKDMVGQAQTGTGKTAAFGIPIIEQLDIHNRNVQAIVMCPTRELAIQVTGELIKIGKHIGGLNAVPVYGGQSIGQQFKALKRGAHVVVGTPGRTIDHLQRGTLKLDHLKMVVFDEADEMLNMGFREDMEKILSYTEGPMQTVMFSATVPNAIRHIMNRYMNNPDTVTIERKKITAPDIEQFMVEVRDSVRTDAICRFMDLHDFNRSLVFCNTKRKTEKLARELQSRGYACDVINGDLSQNQRDRVMGKFRRGDIDILVATDVAARGIDVDDIDVVFNYDVPQDPEYYVHRIGRTGRAGRSGTAITFASRNKKKQLRSIEKMIKSRLQPLSMPSNADVQESRINGQLNEIIETLEKGGLRPWIEQIENIGDERFTTIEIAAALLKLRTGSPEMETAAQPQFNDDGSMIRLHFDLG
ncbi:MAG: DEAD/DEAH box helicase, partial [Balneolaceae bacterium]|nr:DEAD/DEAH box helicase [Balneolaceae bacterium]